MSGYALTDFNEAGGVQVLVINKLRLEGAREVYNTIPIDMVILQQ